MSPHLEKKLLEKFPELYRRYYWGVMQSPMGWGFECPDEWYDSICLLSRKITDYMKKHNCVIEADQVKEKFGTFCFYWSCDDMGEDFSGRIWNDIENMIKKCQRDLSPDIEKTNLEEF